MGQFCNRKDNKKGASEQPEHPVALPSTFSSKASAGWQAIRFLSDHDRILPD
jgi:hypothetical protein